MLLELYNPHPYLIPNLFPLGTATHARCTRMSYTHSLMHQDSAHPHPSSCHPPTAHPSPHSHPSPRSYPDPHFHPSPHCNALPHPTNLLLSSLDVIYPYALMTSCSSSPTSALLRNLEVMVNNVKHSPKPSNPAPLHLTSSHLLNS